MLNTPDTTRRVDLDIACIPSNYSRLIAREMGLQIRDLPSLLRLTDLSTEQFLHDDTLLTSRQQVQIAQNALVASTDDTLGLNIGRRLTPLTHGVMGLLVNSSPDLITTLKAIQAFVPTRMQFARVELMTDDHWLECHGHFDLDLNPDILRLFSEAFAMAFFECAKFILGRPLEEAHTTFIHDEPAYSSHYTQYIPGEIAFSTHQIRVKVPIDVCYIPNVSASQKSYALAYQQCEKILAQLYKQKGTCTYQVQKMMLSHAIGEVSEEDVAAELFISKRTLARKLKQEGSSFRQIRDDLLSQQAASYLKESTMSVEAIAALLNYHDSANFRRAFKRWFGMTPDQYRRQ